MKTHPFERAGRALIGMGAVALIGFASWGGRAIANENLRLKNPESAVRAGGKLGSLGAISFADLNGKTYTRNSIGSSKATVFLFISAQCPISNIYTPRFNALAADYAQKGVQVFAIYSDRQESVADIARHVKDRKLTFPAVKDAHGTLADALGAKLTPEAVVVDAQGAICYRGRIDDNAVVTRVTSHDLTNALNAVLKGEAVAQPAVMAFGCAIRRDAASVVAAKGVPTYAHDVASILRAKCESCHRAGEVAPFTLQDYKQASAWASDIKRYTQNGQMPPWKPDAGYGMFKDVAAHTLSDKEKTVLAKWADSGAPLGNPKDIPSPAKFSSDWKMGTPDVVIQPEKEYHLSPDGEDVYRNFVVKTNFSEDRWLRAVECRPGNRGIVHHIINYIDSQHRADKLEGEDHDGQPGYTSSGGGAGFQPDGFLGGWAPGNDPGELPQGVGTLLPKGANIVVQVHYHKNGKPETDLTKIGLHFAHGTIDKMARSNFVINFGFKLPYGDERHETKATTGIREDCHILSVMPHMHLLGKEMKVWATLPDGTEKPLVWIKDWDFNWQATYQLKEALFLPKGSKVHLVAYYDNSDKNPRNPNRSNPRDVTWGEQTTDEMCIAFLTYTKDAEHMVLNADRPALKQSASVK
jgi:peroxiredoxin